MLSSVLALTKATKSLRRTSQSHQEQPTGKPSGRAETAAASTDGQCVLWDHPPEALDELPAYSGPARTETYTHKAKFCVGSKRLTCCSEPRVVDFKTKAPLFQLEHGTLGASKYVPSALRDMGGREVLSLHPTPEGGFTATVHGREVMHLALAREKVRFPSGEEWRVHRTEAGWRVRTSGGSSTGQSLALLVRDVGLSPRYVVEVAPGVPVAYIAAVALILRLPVYWDRSPLPLDVGYCPNR